MRGKHETAANHHVWPTELLLRIMPRERERENEPVTQTEREIKRDRER